jgi:hypothetical protein
MRNRIATMSLKRPGPVRARADVTSVGTSSGSFLLKEAAMDERREGLESVKEIRDVLDEQVTKLRFMGAAITNIDKFGTGLYDCEGAYVILNEIADAIDGLNDRLGPNIHDNQQSQGESHG